MTDRELLELAARAAGFPAGWVIQDWNPLTDDGDALRLSVKLRLSIDHNPPTAQQPWVSAGRQGCEGCYDPVTCVEDEFDEPQRGAATRRAIVRAAAEIWRTLQATKATGGDAAWSDLKIAFDIPDGEDETLWKCVESGAITLPNGWKLIETTGAGGVGPVAVFRTEHLPTSSETFVVGSAINCAIAASKEKAK